MPEVRQSSTNPAYPRLAHNLAIAICMVDRNVIEFDKEYSCSEFADLFNKIHINMNLGHKVRSIGVGHFPLPKLLCIVKGKK